MSAWGWILIAAAVPAGSAAGYVVGWWRGYREAIEEDASLGQFSEFSSLTDD